MRPDRWGQDEGRAEVTCSLLVRKPPTETRVECGKEAVVLYTAPRPDAYGVTEYPRCAGHDTATAQEWAIANDWKREALQAELEDPH